MSDEQKAFCQVPFDVFDMSDHEDEGVRGFYYSFPIDDEDKVHPSEVPLAGPHPTEQAAVDAAIAFIKDALAEHVGNGLRVYVSGQ